MILSPLDFVHLNGFYRRPGAGVILFKLYKGVCQGCGKPIDSSNETPHMGHIIPQSHPEEFTQRFPGLDVDNLLNLHLLHGRCNLLASNVFVASEFSLNQMYAISGRLLVERLPNVDKELAKPKTPFDTANEVIAALEADACRSPADEWAFSKLTAFKELYETAKTKPKNRLAHPVDESTFYRFFNQAEFGSLTNVQGALPAFKKTFLEPELIQVLQQKKGDWSVALYPGQPPIDEALSLAAVCAAERSGLADFALVVERKALLRALKNCINLTLHIHANTDGTMVAVCGPNTQANVPNFPGLAEWAEQSFENYSRR